MAEIITCPDCSRKLQVPESYYGQTVQCPECAHLFVADPLAQRVQTTAPAAGAKWETQDRPLRRADDSDDDELDVTRRPSRRAEVAHRGGLILAIGIISLVMPFPFALCGPFAWVMGNTDLAEMRAGRMDPSGEGMVHAGRVLGIISTILLIVAVGTFCLIFSFAMMSRH